MRSSVKKGKRTTEVLIAAGALALAGCGRPGNVETVGGDPSLRQRAIDFNFDSLDEHPVSSAAMRGKTTVLAFVTTFDLQSQAQVDYLAAMAKHDGDRVNYAIVALEQPANRELVESFRGFISQKFGVLLTTALGDAATIAGGGPFGDVHVVPTVVVLDRAGAIVWEKTGLSRSEDIRAGMRSP